MKKKDASTSQHNNIHTETDVLGSPDVSILPVASGKEYAGINIDRMYHAWLSHFSGWLSPTTARIAYLDWFSHLRISPARQLDIINNAADKYAKLYEYSFQAFQNSDCEPCVPVRKGDHRFINDSWNQYPFNLYSQAFLLCEQFWKEATTYTHGTSVQNQRLVNFTTRQALDIFSPSNYPWLNPEVIQCTMDQSGMNFLRGMANFVDDTKRHFENLPPAGAEKFQVGVNVAITPGKVVFQSNLIELIQYQPTTTSVCAEPILFVPAWIMKYYILDLSDNNSMVKYLVNKGHTVFMISWKNPSSADRDLGIEDYINLGIMDALKAVNAIVPNQKVHGVGYCIGGTFLMIAAGEMANRNDDRFKTLTLFAAQVDFKDAGELLLFIDESQVAYLEDIMYQKGYLDGSQMAGAFSMLRSIDLIWSRLVHDYQLGNRREVNDLMAWDYDTTRLPYKMHSEYLRKLFLNNDLVQGRFIVNENPISLPNISTPIFTVSTVKDHVAPWKSVYKMHLFMDTEITFVLTNAGHNTGIVNPPGTPNRKYKMMVHTSADKYVPPEVWYKQAQYYEGSWWHTWEEWLSVHSDVHKIPPPAFGNPKKGYKILRDAPGEYVLQK